MTQVEVGASHRQKNPTKNMSLTSWHWQTNCSHCFLQCCQLTSNYQIFGKQLLLWHLLWDSRAREVKPIIISNYWQLFIHYILFFSVGTQTFLSHSCPVLFITLIDLTLSRRIIMKREMYYFTWQHLQHGHLSCQSIICRCHLSLSIFMFVFLSHCQSSRPNLWSRTSRQAGAAGGGERFVFVYFV